MSPHTDLSGFATVTLQQRGELPVLHIANACAEAAIALQGAQLLTYTPRGSKPVLWLSEQASWRRGQPVRGGIPICWPWFGATERNPRSVQGMVQGSAPPAHGLVRDRDWTLRGIRELPDRTDITLGFITDHQTHRHWPQAAELTLEVSVGESLQLRLSTRNTGDGAIALTQALHTYFAVGAIDATSVTGLEQSRYIDTLDDWRENSQQGAISFHGETDRIYLDLPATMQLHDRSWERVIGLRTEHSASAVVWNPWIDKGSRMSQLAPAAWRDFVCIETANVLADQVVLAPGETALLGLHIDCASRERSSGDTGRGTSGLQAKPHQQSAAGREALK